MSGNPESDWSEQERAQYERGRYFTGERLSIYMPELDVNWDDIQGGLETPQSRKAQILGILKEQADHISAQHEHDKDRPESKGSFEVARGVVKILDMVKTTEDIDGAIREIRAYLDAVIGRDPMDDSYYSD